VYSIKHKDETFDMFLTHRMQVQNEINWKIQRIRSNKCSDYVFVNWFLCWKGITHGVTHHIYLNLMK